MREEAGYTAVEACEPLKAQGPKLSKIENGRQGATPEEVRVLCDFYRASAEERDYLVSLAEQRPKRRRRRAGQRDAVPDWFRRFLALEWDATEIKSYHIEMVPGLLQTEDYARAMIRAWEPEADERLIEKEPEEYTQYSSVYGRLRGAALTPEESVAFIDRMAKEYT